MEIGVPDFIGFIAIIIVGINANPIVTLEYISIGIHQHGYNLSLLKECFKQVHKNDTCQDLDDVLQSGLSSLNMVILIVKGILATVFVYFLGAVSDVVGRKVPIIFLLSMNLVWCCLFLVNTIYVTSFPSQLYILQQGVVLSLCGGSAFSINLYLVAYLSVTVPAEQRTARFGILYAVGILGLVLGPIISGNMIARTKPYYIAILSCSLALINITVAVFGLTNRNDPEVVEQLRQRETLMSKLNLAARLQLKNIKGLFSNKKTRLPFIGTLFMFMNASAGLATPLVVIIVVYSLGEPFNWGTKTRSYVLSGLGAAVALQSGLTIKLLEYIKLSRPGIVRLGMSLGFISTIIMAFAKTSPVLVVGVVLCSFMAITVPPLQSMTLSLVEEQQTGAAIGLMAAIQNIAETGLVNIVLLVYKSTRSYMNGCCFFVVSILIGASIILTLFYHQPPKEYRRLDDSEFNSILPHTSSCTNESTDVMGTGDYKSI